MGREHWRLPNVDYLQTLAYAVVIGIQAEGYTIPTYWRWMSTAVEKRHANGVSKQGIVPEQTIHARCDGERVVVSIPVNEWEVLPKGNTSIYALSLREEIMLRKLVSALGGVSCEHSA